MMTRVAPLLCVRTLFLVTLCGCALIGGVRTATMEQIQALVEGPLWNQTTISISGGLSGSIPPELGSLTNLTKLSLSSNSLSGFIPPQLGNLTNLRTLSISFTDLSGPIPAELGSLINLESLDISDNRRLSGPIPSELGSLTNLTALILIWNSLSGPIPPELGNLTKLITLNLYWNRLSGPIPPELGSLPNLITLDLSQNSLPGPIPPGLGRLTNLESLDISDNNLLGSIPPELGSLTNLKRLDVSDNELSGPIPPELGNLSSLNYLYLSFNDLSGSIPPELGSLTNLKNLWISHNSLFGPIPPELGNLIVLYQLDLEANDLSGPIPPELGSLLNFNTLKLSHNDLSGPIPLQIGDLTNLSSLALSDNNLSGPIPSQLGDLTKLQLLALSNNNLSGPIPPQLGSLIALRNLSLSYNSLLGPIPTELGKLTNLTYLYLSDNNLSGPIPPLLSDLTKLELLYLSNNHLSGPIPRLLGNITTLMYLRIYNNSLSGPIPQSALRFDAMPLSFYPGNSGLCCTNCNFSAPCVFPPSSSVGPIVGGVLAGAALLLALATLGFCLHRRRKRMSNRGPQPGLEEGGKNEPQDGVVLKRPVSEPRQKYFTFKQLQKATRSFNDATVIGRGSFGTVYKGVLPNGSVVAIKRLEARPGRKDIEERSWKAEVEALGRVRHKNLVPLLGVCAERGERLLVFEYFARGSLDRRLHLLKDGEAVLTWADRMSIARSICRGLIYLHNDIRPSMIHRDIKAANILLTNDDLATACIADFGLAHLVQDTGGKTSTMVKGTVPYMAPEYLHGGTRFLSPKCDVYSFGMLFLELISGRLVVRQLESGVVERLLKVATDMVKEGRTMELVDPALGNDYDAEEARNYIHVALACLRTDPSARPTMEGVGSQLALASVVDSSFKEEDVWESEGSSAYLDSLGSSSGVRSTYSSTVQVASRFVTPR